jgi:hypothetical protein
MAMLYLTPVLPLGLVSYACGTTTMDVSSFALAKIASLPLYLVYTFIGASAHSFIKRGAGEGTGIGQSVSEEAKKLEENQFLLVSGLLLSIVMMTLITRHIRKELMKVRRTRHNFHLFLDASFQHPFCLIMSSFFFLFRQILDQQKKEKSADSKPVSLDIEGNEDVDEKTLEMGLTSRRKTSSKMTGTK